jgi:hypothetical protein
MKFATAKRRKPTAMKSNQREWLFFRDAISSNEKEISHGRVPWQTR